MMTDFPAAAIYTGAVRHCRFRPKRHVFSRRLFMLWSDADLAAATHPAGGGIFPGWRRRDFLRPDIPSLRDAALQETAAQTGIRARGPVYVLAQPRQFGVAYNPVAFYIVCDGGEPAALLAEVDNTPWRERFCHVAPFDSRRRATLKKRGHVSPFNPMAMRYEWRFALDDGGFFVRMRCLRDGESAPDMTVFMRLTRRDFSRRGARAAALAQPCAAATSAAMIYWQALRLWLKGAPVYPHPRR